MDGGIISKLRKERYLTRSDKIAIEILKRGMLNRERLRFITLTGVGMDFPFLFRQLKSFLRRKMGSIAYFGCRTGEGGGVVHFVYEGKSVRYKELSNYWREISGYWNVHISRVRNYQAMVNELTRQYQKIRYFHSHNWLPKSSYQIPLFD